MFKERIHKLLPLIIAMLVTLDGLINFILGILPIFRNHFDDKLVTTYTRYLEVLPIQHASSLLSVF